MWKQELEGEKKDNDENEMEGKEATFIKFSILLLFFIFLYSWIFFIILCVGEVKNHRCCETQGVEALIFTFVDVLGRFEIFLVKSYSRSVSMVEYNVFSFQKFGITMCTSQARLMFKFYPSSFSIGKGYWGFFAF